MKYKVLIYMCVLVFSNAYSQNLDSFLKNRKSKFVFSPKKSDTKAFDKYMTVKNKHNNLKEINTNKRFKILNQTYKGIDVFSATKKINFDANGNSIFYSDNTINYTNIEKNNFPKIEDILTNNNIKESDIVKYTKVYFPISEKTIIPALKIIIKNKNKLYLKIFDSKHDIIYKKKLTKEAHINIEEATASVFYPDPITSALTTYYGDFTHNKGASNRSIEEQQKNVAIYCKYENGIYYLENDFVKITDLSSPHWYVVTSEDGKFIFNRSEIGFQQVNAFYHISEFKKCINSYGFSDAVDYQIEVDADGADGDDNSFFTPKLNEKNGNLEFGAYVYGNVEHIPDAEDSEVIIHEYTHAIVNSYNNEYTSYTSNERECLEEAIADYFAVSYSYNINSYNWQSIFKWDGHNEFWDGRLAVSSKCYDEITFNSNIYEHTDILVAPLMELFLELGKEATDKLVLHTITGLNSNTSMVDVAHIILKTDSIYNDSENTEFIYNTFNKYCILQQDTIPDDDLHTTDNFKITKPYTLIQKGGLYITFNQYFSGKISIYNLKGQLIISENVTHKKKYSINSSILPSNIYILKIGDFEAVKFYKK